MKRIICMLVVMAAVATAAQAWVVDADEFNTSGGWNAIWNNPMTWDVYAVDADETYPNGGVKAWWFEPTNSNTVIQPGGAISCETNKWWTRPSVAAGGKSGTNRYAYAPAADVTKWGVTFVDPSQNGDEADVAVVASYISPGYLFVQHDWGYQYFRPDVYSWENRPYFKTDARIAAVNANGAVLRIKSYAYLPDGAWDTAPKTLISYTDIALGDDMVWQDIHRNCVAKANAEMASHDTNVVVNAWLLFELEVIGGTADTKVFIDEIDFMSDVTGDASYGAPDWVYVPEPATMSILALGGLLLRRKK